MGVEKGIAGILRQIPFEITDCPVEFLKTAVVNNRAALAIKADQACRNFCVGKPAGNHEPGLAQKLGGRIHQIPKKSFARVETGEKAAAGNYQIIFSTFNIRQNLPGWTLLDAENISPDTRVQKFRLGM
jgi:hypothetical protein